MAKRMNGLGKGLGALLDVDAINTEESTNSIIQVEISQIDINKEQPRKQFDEEKLMELTESIKQHGMIQPIVAKKRGDRYLIIAGERRFRASIACGFTSVPVIVKDVDDAEVMELSLIENIQRADLNPVEEARAIKALIEKCDYMQEECAMRLSMSRSAVANSLRLLTLDDEILTALELGVITAGHARALLMIENEQQRKTAYRRIITEKLSVRQVEALSKLLKAGKTANQKKNSVLSADMRTAEKKLCEIFDAKVQFKGNENKGKLFIEYNSAEQLQKIYELLTNGR